MITKIELTEQELQALTQLIDLACKAGGLQVAKVASHMLDKLTAAVEAAKAETNVIKLPEKESA